MFRFHRHAIGVAICIAVAAAQSINVKGEFDLPPGDRLHYYVELRLVGAGSPVARELVHPDGSFEFRQVDPGAYDLVAASQYGDVIARDHVSLAAHGAPLLLKRRTPLVTQASGGRVSVRALTYKPPKQARDLFRKAVRASEKKRSAEAIALLEKAVALAPDYAEAVNNLAVQLYLRRDFARSATLLRHAHALEPDAAAITSNLAATLIPLGRAAEAEALARQAARAAPGLPRTSYVLALTLIAQGKSGDEAEALLRGVADQMPAARTTLEAWKSALR